jgi:hypothetical protein
MATPTPPSDSSSNPMPTWLSIPIIVLCLLGGGWLIHWYLISDPLSHDVKVFNEPMRNVTDNGKGNVFSSWLNGAGKKPGKGNGLPHVIPLDEQKDRWEVKTEVAELIAFNQNGALNVRALYNNSRAVLPKEVYETLSATNELIRDRHADALKLTTDQTRRLRTLSNVNDMTLNPADKKTLEDEMARFIHSSGADRQALEPKLYQSLDQAAKNSIPATVHAATEHAAEINKIMTPELWKQNAAANTPLNTPSNTPANVPPRKAT